MSTATQTATGVPVLLRDDREGIATLTLNRPDQFNSLSEELIEAVQQALDAIARDRSVRVVVLAGAGRAFCAGHDLREMRARPDQGYYRELFGACARMMMGIVRLPQPVIARVHGIATAAGCQLVATCDLALAASTARFAVSGINLGLFCSTPGVALSRNVSRKHAFEMLFTGDFVDADTAVRVGLINRSVPSDELDGEVATLAQAIVAKTPVAVETGKRMFYQQIEKDLEAAYEYAGEVMSCNMMSEDTTEGIDAFLEKRQPTWKGR